MEEHHSVIAPTIPKDSLILVTGVTGYIAGHIVDQLLSDGYRVRGTVRDLSKTKWMYNYFDDKYGKGRFEAVLVRDMVAENAFDEAVKGVQGVVHAASVMSFSSNPDEVIPPTVKGALNIMTAATKESGIKAVVYTSSSTAALLPETDKVIKINPNTWNDAACRAADEPNPAGFTVYGASKTHAERAIWKVVEETSPPFQVATVLPNSNFGPILQPGAEDSSSTGSFIVGLYKGDAAVFDSMPPQWFVDVRDTAKLHVIALVDPSCNGQRLFAFAQPFNWNDVLAILRKQNPGKSFPEDRESGRDLSEIPNQQADRLLEKHYGRGFIGLEETVKANTATLS